MATTLKEVEELMIPLGGVQQKLDGVVDSVPLDKGCEVLDDDWTHEQLDENDSENFADSDDGHILLKWGGGERVIIRCYEGWKISKSAIWPPTF